MTQAGAAPVAAAAPTPSAGERQQLCLAVLLLERGRHGDALSALQPLLAQHASSPQLQCLQGCCLAALGSRPQARRANGRRIVSCSVLHPTGWQCMGVVPPRSGGLVRATPALRGPPCPHALLGRPTPQPHPTPLKPHPPPPQTALLQALAAFAAALAQQPGCVPALLGCAGVYKDTGLLGESLQALQRALAATDRQAAAALQQHLGAAEAAGAAGGPGVGATVGAAAAAEACPVAGTAAAERPAGKPAGAAAAAPTALAAAAPDHRQLEAGGTAEAACSAREGQQAAVALEASLAAAAAAAVARCIPCNGADVRQALAVVLTDIGESVQLKGRKMSLEIP